MAYLSPLELLRLEVWAMRPEMLSKLTQLMAAVEQELGLRTFVRDFGGYRGPGIQTQLLAWRNQADAADGIIGGGRDYYAVAPAGASHHEYGAAADLAIVDPAQRTDANYRRIAELSRRLGLRPGYYFAKKDEFHHQLEEPIELARERWRAMMRTRALLVAAAAAAVLVLTFFFPRAGGFA